MTPCRRRRSRGGFALIALIGVLAVISILSAVILPDMINVTKINFGDIEENNLRVLALGLERHIILNKNIPDEDTDTDSDGTPDWIEDIADQVNISTVLVQTNEVGNTRYYVWDLNSVPNPDDTAGGYSQQSDQDTNDDGVNDLTLTGSQIRPRLLIISSVGAQPTQFAGGATLASGEAPTESDFNELWDWDEQSAVLNLSAAQAVEDLKIQRIDTGHLFFTMTLKNDSESQMLISGNGFYGDGVSSGTRNLLMVPPNTEVIELTLDCDELDSGDNLYLDVGCDSDCSSSYFLDNTNAGSGVCGSVTKDLPIDSDGAIIQVSLVSGTTSEPGYVTATVKYQADVSYQLDATTAASLTAGNNATLNVIQGTKITLLDSAGVISHIMFANNSDGFRYLPGPAQWKQSGL